MEQVGLGHNNSSKIQIETEKPWYGKYVQSDLKGGVLTMHDRDNMMNLILSCLMKTFKLIIYINENVNVYCHLVIRREKLWDNLTMVKILLHYK